MPRSISAPTPAQGRSICLNPVTVQGTIGKKEVRGKVGGGGVPVQVQTGSGNIVIE